MESELNSREQSIRELKDLRKRVAELEALKLDHEREKRGLQERGERYRQIVKKASEAIMVLQNGVIRFVNSKALELFGYSGELTPRSFGEFIHPEDREKVLTRYQKRIRGEWAPESYSFRIIDTHGCTKWVEIKAALISWENKPAILILLNDITERKRAEEALRRSEEEAQRLAKENEIIAEVGRIISSTLDIDEVYEGFAKEVRKLIPFDGIAIVLINQDQESMIVTYVSGSHIQGRKAGEIFPLKDSISWETARRKSGFLVQPDTGEELERQFPVLVPTYQAGMRSMLQVPLIYRDKVIGSLLLRAQKAKAYTDHDLRLAERIAAQIAGAIANAQLYHEREQMEEDLRESEEKYRLLAEKANEGICVVQDSKFQFVNPKMAEILGYAEGELISRPFLDFIHPEDRELALGSYRKLRNGGVIPSVDPFRIVDKDGNTKWLELNTTMITWEKRPASLNFLSDITERKQAEEALRASEERYRNFFNNAQIGLYQARISDGLIIEANPRMAQIYGYSNREACIGEYMASEHYIDPGTRERLLMQLQKNGEVRNFETRMSRKDGSIFWERFSSRIYPEKGYIEGVVADITEEKLAEEKLRESEERYRLLVENAPLGILSIDRKGQIVNGNSVLLSIMGSPSKQAIQAINIFTFPPLVETGVPDNVRRCLESGEPGIYETPIKNKEDKEVYLRYHLTPIRDMNDQVAGVQALVEDITEKKKLEAQLLQVQKLEAIGTLAGGVAHDFNNILAAIMGYAELASWEAPQGSKAEHNMNELLKAGRRAKDLVQQILTFSRQSSQERKPVEIGPIVKETLKLLRASLPSTVEIRQYIGDDADVVNTDPTQIHQVVMNLCTNAAHAMREKGGILEVGLHRVNMDASTAARYQDLHPGPYIRLSVSDTGHGMTPEILNRIFDPYFTTKKAGEGTGLGLAIVHGIVKSHGGEITVSSEPGKGTTFHVLLPSIDQAKEVGDTQKGMASLIGGQESVLFVDDEPALLDVGKQILEHLGYKVDVRMSSMEALELFRKQPKRFDLVITDMTMPAMMGDRLARELMRIRSDIPIILCTGFSEHVSEEKVKEMGIREFAMKPLVASDLARTVRRALDHDGKHALHR